MVKLSPSPIVAAIDVGTNAVRLEIARRLPDGSLETLHQERDPVRPGEGVFTHGALPREVADRLLSTLRRYAALCRRHGAHIRAVATSAIREARNRDDIVRRARSEAGLKLEVISGVEEARLICLGVLHGKREGQRSLCVDIGGGSTEVASAVGEEPSHMWTVNLGAVRLTELFDTSGRVSSKQLRLLREYAMERLQESLPRRIPLAPRRALGSSGTINAVVTFAADNEGRASRRQITQAIEELSEMSPAERRRRFDPKRAEIIVAGAVVLESVMGHLGLESVTGVQRGLRDGVLIDFFRRQRNQASDASLFEAALAVGKRFGHDEGHARQVSALACRLFDDLAHLHGLPASARPLLEVAGLLHDIGNSVSYQRHHKHTQYLIQNAEIPGLDNDDRERVARIARFHRRSFPDSSHAELEGLPLSEVRVLRKLACLLRVADSFDQGRRQVVHGISARVSRQAVMITLRAQGPLDLELWDAGHEATHFRKVFGRRLTFQVKRSRVRPLATSRSRAKVAVRRGIPDTR